MKKSLRPQTLVYPTPVFIIGTYSQDGKPNAMNAAWGGICCSGPPCIAVSVRKARQTYENIVANQAFTINIPSERHVKEADYFGIVSGKSENKFEVTGLTPVKSELVNAPYIGEFPLILECKLVHTYDLGAHTQFIGEILDVKADEEVLGDKGSPEVEKVLPLLYCPDAGMGYYAVGRRVAQAFSVGRELKTGPSGRRRPVNSGL
jgi:flavin reductase (DIM6/NTAB) family NADH-FMN oxidoreductase RutF